MAGACRVHLAGPVPRWRERRARGPGDVGDWRRHGAGRFGSASDEAREVRVAAGLETVGEQDQARGVRIGGGVEV